MLINKSLAALRSGALMMALLTLCCASSYSQTTLAKGDINIVGWNSNGSDEIAFVCWVDLAPSTVIRFMDNGWNSSQPSTVALNCRNLEQIATWTNTTGATITAGTVIKLNVGFPSSANYGTVDIYSNGGGTNPFMALGNMGDQITIYQSTNLIASLDFGVVNASASTFLGNVLYGFTWSTGWLTSGSAGSATSYLPSDLTGFNLAFSSGTGTAQGGNYVGSRTNLTKAQYQASINNISNWSTTSTSVSLDLTIFGVSGTLPVNVENYTATVVDGQGVISWTTTHEERNADFLLERSNDAQHYTLLKKIEGRGSFNGSSNYRFVDAKPMSGTNYYRLRQADVDGTIHELGVKMIKIETGQFIVSPNPVMGRSVMVDLGVTPGTAMMYKLVDAAGNQVQTGSLSQQRQEIRLGGHVAAGQYVLMLSTGRQVKLIVR